MLNLEEHTSERPRASGSMVDSSAKVLLSALVVLLAITATVLFTRGATEHGNAARPLGTSSASTDAADAAAATTARQMVSQNGGSDSTVVLLVHTSSTEAAKALYPDFTSDNTGDDPVIVAYSEGDFVGNMTKRPPDAKPPTGPFFFVMFDATGERVRAWGVLPKVPDVSSLGKGIQAP